MHEISSFIGAVGTLMDGSGLTELMPSTFAGVTKVMTGKKFLQAFRASRLAVEEPLQHIISCNHDASMDELCNP